MASPFIGKGKGHGVMMHRVKEKADQVEQIKPRK